MRKRKVKLVIFVVGVAGWLIGLSAFLIDLRTSVIVACLILICATFLLILIKLMKSAKKKRHKYESNKRLLDFLLQWFDFEAENKDYTPFFRENSIGKIAIFGYDSLGKKLFRSLEDSDISVLYFIDDNKPENCSDVNIVLIDELGVQEHVDAIMLSPLQNYKGLLKKIHSMTDSNTQIISIWDVIREGSTSI